MLKEMGLGDHFAQPLFFAIENSPAAEIFFGAGVRLLMSFLHTEHHDASITLIGTNWRAPVS
jgi:hypothetical protein